MYGRKKLALHFNPGGRIRSGVPISVPSTVFDVAYQTVIRDVNTNLLFNMVNKPVAATFLSKKQYVTGKRLMIGICPFFREYFY